jgi:hypothetical protein
MSDALRQAIESGAYTVDPEAVAVAIIGRAHALRAARACVARSAVLVAAEDVEIRRIRADEADPCPLEGAA